MPSKTFLDFFPVRFIFDPMIRIFENTSREEIKRVMQDVRVDPYGIKIMLPKAATRLVRITSLSNIAANILKQEMLSLGADAAVARGALTGAQKKTDCLLMGTPAQFSRLNEKLNKQPFGLSRLSEDLSLALKNFERNDFILSLKDYRISLGRRTRIMGILNLSPDSFSGDGLSPQDALRHAQKLTEDGADVIDVGGESTRPGARPVPLKEELRRVIPVIKALAKKIRVPISVDTYKPEVASLALDSGAAMVNDISGLRNKVMLKVVSRKKAGVVIMHMQGRPRTMQENPSYESLIEDILSYLDCALKKAVDAGIDREKIIIDPGIGFGKDLKQNLRILKHLGEFKTLGLPILVGPSRKSFIGRILGCEPKERIFGTVSSCVLAAKAGAHMVRVHDVKEVAQALALADAINNS